MSATTDTLAHAGHAHGHDEHHDGPQKGIRRWLTTTNHKDIGTMYLVFSLIMFLIGGGMALVIRAELFVPGMQLVDPGFFNTMTTVHALIMVFGAVMPATVGLANWMLPLQIGAPDMALPRMNNFSFWLLVAAFSLLILSLFMPGGGPASGWTLYPPLVLQTGDALPLAIFAIHLAGASSIMGAINIIVTIMNMRAPGMTLLAMPMFAWTWLITAYLLIAVMPVFAGAVTMLLTDHFFGTTFFSAAGGGDPVLYQHIFWFFGHPEVYIMILPAFGIVSEIIPTFSRKKLFGYNNMVYATASIAFLSFVVWAHHMFTVGMPLAGEMFFMLATMLIAVPTGVKIFNWTATMWRGLDLLRAADALRARVPVPVHDRRVLGADDGDRPRRLPVPRHVFHRRAFPLRARAGRGVRHHGGGVLLAAEVDRSHVRHEARESAFLAVRDLRQRAVLPAAFPRTGRHAAPHPRLLDAVRRLEHGVLDRRIRLRAVAAPVRVHHLALRPGRAARVGRGMGRRAQPRSRMDGALARAVSHVRRAAHRARRRDAFVTGELPDEERRRRIRRNTVVLALIALAIYVAFIASGVIKSQP